jgi:predicted nucleotidyltransferase
MKLEEVLKIIAANKDGLKEYSVKSLAIFGSVARNEATDASDIDVLVEFEEGKPIGLFEFIRLMHFLQEILGCRVDLATPEALRKEMSEQILKEAIRAA